MDDGDGKVALIGTPVEELLKVDSRGRVRVNAKRREALLGEYDRVGLSGPDFAAHYGIKYQTLATWLQKRKRAEAAQAAVGKMKWLEVETKSSVRTMEPGEKCGGLQVELPGGARLEIENGDQITLAAGLIVALEKAKRPC